MWYIFESQERCRILIRKKPCILNQIFLSDARFSTWWHQFSQEKLFMLKLPFHWSLWQFLSRAVNQAMFNAHWAHNNVDLKPCMQFNPKSIYSWLLHITTNDTPKLSFMFSYQQLGDMCRVNIFVCGDQIRTAACP